MRPFDDDGRARELTVTTRTVSIAFTAASMNACTPSALAPLSDDEGAM